MSQYRWLILLLLGVAFFLRVDLIYYILYVTIGIYLWSRWTTARALRHVVAERDYRQRAFLGEVVPVRLRLTNNSRLSVPWIQFHESVPPELRMEQAAQRAISLGGKRSHTVTYHVKGLQRGYYRLGPLRLTSGDLFGLATPRTGTLPPSYLTVYPRIIPLVQLGLTSRLPFGTVGSKQRLFEDPARPLGTREFRSGDSLRQMNWKASAHTQKMLVRTFEPAISLETHVLLNLHSADYERRDRHYLVEWAIVIASSLAAHLTNQRQAIGLSSNGVDPLFLHEAQRVFDEVTGRLLFETDRSGQDYAQYMPPIIEPRAGRPHLMKVMELLARLESRETIPFHDWATSATTTLSWGVTVIAITARGDAQTCNTLHQLTRSGFNPVLIAVEPDANFGLVRERARRLGFQAFNVYDRRDLTRWQRPQGAPGQQVGR